MTLGSNSLSTHGTFSFLFCFLILVRVSFDTMSFLLRPRVGWGEKGSLFSGPLSWLVEIDSNSLQSLVLLDSFADRIFIVDAVS